MRRIVLAVGLVFALLVVHSSPAEAKSFTFPSIHVTATVNPDASMDVVERLTYSFEGQFRNGYRPIPRGDYEITKMDVKENGSPVPFEGAPYNLSWHFSAADETRTFEVSYKVIGAVKVAPDVGELNWKWIGSDHTQVDLARAAVELPTATNVKAWGHGPIDGTVRIDGNTVRYSAQPLQSSTFFEGHVVVPSSAFTVKPTGGERLPAILAQEQKDADEANAQRERSTTEDHEREVAFNIVSGAAMLGAALVFLFVWRRWGRDPKRPDSIGEYFYEPPDVAPATVVQVLGRGNKIAGTIVDLAQRGALRIEEFDDESGFKAKIFGGRKKDWRLTKTGELPQNALPFEHRMASYIFKSGDTTTQAEMKKWSEKNQSKAQKFTRLFDSEVKDTADWMYRKNDRILARALNSVAALGLIGAGFVAVAFGGPLGFLAIALGALFLLLNVVLTARTEMAVQKRTEWNAFRNYLKDFGNFQDAPVGHLILWERYLVFGVALGVAKELAQGLQLRMPELAADPTFAAWYVASSGTGDFGQFESFSAFGDSVSSSTSSWSDGSGGGGGFSGGGGDGGGGGGAGAN